jgi:hypothetical protein
MRLLSPTLSIFGALLIAICLVGFADFASALPQGGPPPAPAYDCSLLGTDCDAATDGCSTYTWLWCSTLGKCNTTGVPADCGATCHCNYVSSRCICIP